MPVKTVLEFEAKVGAQRYVADMNRYDPKIGLEILNTFAVKGPVFFVDSSGEPRYVLTDRKDDTYPNVGIRRKLVFRGGNYREPADLIPMDVWRREVRRETRPFISGISEEEAKLLHAAILNGAKVHADYFTALPGHKLLNPNLPQPWYCDIASVVASEVPLELNT